MKLPIPEALVSSGLCLWAAPGAGQPSLGVIFPGQMWGLSLQGFRVGSCCRDCSQVCPLASFLSQPPLPGMAHCHIPWVRCHHPSLSCPGCDLEVQMLKCWWGEVAEQKQPRHRGACLDFPNFQFLD